MTIYRCVCQLQIPAPVHHNQFHTCLCGFRWLVILNEEDRLTWIYAGRKE